MNRFLCFFVAAATGLSVTSVALADPKPSGAKNADPQMVIEMYLGKTWVWSKGGSYWGGGGAFQAVWDDDPSNQTVSYTDGKWYVTSKGTLCYETIWQWTGKDKPDEVLKNCWRHVVDPEGRIWRSDHRDQNDFHRPAKSDFKNGNAIKSTYSKYKRMVDG